MSAITLLAAPATTAYAPPPDSPLGWAMNYFTYDSERGAPDESQTVPTDGWVTVNLDYFGCGAEAQELLGVVSAVITTASGAVLEGTLRVLEAAPPNEWWPSNATLAFVPAAPLPPAQTLGFEMTLDNPALEGKWSCASPAPAQTLEIAVTTTAVPSSGPAVAEVWLYPSLGFTSCPSLLLEVGASLPAEEMNHSVVRFLRVEPSLALTQMATRFLGNWYNRGALSSASASVGFPSKQDQYCVIVETGSLLSGDSVRGEPSCVLHAELDENVRSDLDAPCSPPPVAPPFTPGTEDTGCAAARVGRAALLAALVLLLAAFRAGRRVMDGRAPLR